MYKDKELVIRPAMEQDLEKMWELIFKDEAPEWKKWDAPYYPHKAMSYEEFVEISPRYIEKMTFGS